MKNKKKETVLISCGGTGGHILPGLSVGKEFIENSYQVIYLLSDKPIAKKFVINDKNFIIVPQINFDNILRIKIFFEIFKIFKIFKTLFLILLKYRIKIICSCGSGSSILPVIFFRVFGKKTVLLEQNVIMGKANRILINFIDKAYLNFPCKNINSSKNIVCGNPVTQFKKLKNPSLRNEAIKKLNLEDGKYTILFIGGSQGSRKLNALAKSLIADVLKIKSNIQVIHLTGDYDYNEMKQFYASLNIPFFIEKFYSDMEYIYSLTDIAVARSGAGVLSELAYYSIPSLLIPFPFAKENHQLENAKFFEDEGYCKVFEEKDISMKYEEILNSILDGKSFFSVKNMEASWNRKDSASFIVKDIIGILK